MRKKVTSSRKTFLVLVVVGFCILYLHRGATRQLLAGPGDFEFYIALAGYIVSITLILYGFVGAFFPNKLPSEGSKKSGGFKGFLYIVALPLVISLYFAFRYIVWFLSF